MAAGVDSAARLAGARELWAAVAPFISDTGWSKGRSIVDRLETEAATEAPAKLARFSIAVEHARTGRRQHFK